MLKNKIILAAHRGDREKFPENTMPAFESAIKFGADMIETDIHMTLDHKLIIMHDMSAKRTAGVDRRICDMTFDEVKSLDAGKIFSEEFTGTQVPSVEEFLELISKTNLSVNWELKDYPNEVGDERAFEVADRMIEFIEKFNMEKRSMLNSFSDRVLEHIYKKCGHKYPLHGQGIYKCKRTKDISEISEEELFDWACMYSEEEGKSPLDYKENFEYSIKNNIIPCICIPDEVDTYRKAIEYGCRMFTTNNMYKAQKVLEELGVR